MVTKSKRAFRTISEAADDLDVPQHVLRFWETKFTAIKPMKRGGNRRFYRPEDIDVLKAIKHHLYDQGQSIKEVQGVIRDMGVKSFVEGWKEAAGIVDEVEISLPEPETEAAPEPIEDAAEYVEPEPEPDLEPEPEIEQDTQEAEPGLTFEAEEETPEPAAAEEAEAAPPAAADDAIKVSKDLVRALVNDLKALRALIDRLPD